jgi:tetratricopeptide (TPR) repeat protein
MSGRRAVSLLAAAVVVVAGACRGAPPPAVEVDLQGFRGLEEGPGEPLRVFVTGEPMVLLVALPGTAADVEFAAWIALPSPLADSAASSPFLARYPLSSGESNLATVEAVDGELRAVVSTDGLVVGEGEVFELAVAAWVVGDEAAVAEVERLATEASWPPPDQTPRAVALHTFRVVVDGKDRRTRDAGEAVVACRAAYKERSEDVEALCLSAAASETARDRMLAQERLGFLARRQDRQDQAGLHFEQAAAQAADGGRPDEQTTYLRLAAHSRGEAGDYLAARDLAARALAIDTDIGHLAWQARDHTNLGFLAARLGRPGEAVAALRRSRDIARRLARTADEANALIALGAAHQAAGQYSRALAAMDEAAPLLALAPDAAPHEREAWSTYLTNLGWFQLHARRRGLIDVEPSEIEASFEAAAAIHRELDLDSWVANDLMNLARLDLQRGQVARAGARVGEAEAVLADAVTFEHLNYLLSLKGEVALAANCHDDALALYEQLAQAEGPWAAGWWSAYGRARALAGAGEHDQAIAAFEQTLELLEGEAALLDPLIERSYFLGDRDEVYEQYVGLLVGLGRAHEAFAVSERGRDRASRATARAATLDTGSPEVERGVAQLSAALVELQRHEEDEGFLLPGQRPGWEQRRDEQLERVVRAQAALATHAEPADGTPAVGPERLAAALPAGATGLYFHVTATAVLRFVLTADGELSVQAHPLARTELAREVRAFREAIERGEGVESPAGLVHAVLPDDLPAGGTLVVFPHGPLHDLPFGALADPEGPLVRRYGVALAPSAAVWTRARGTAPIDGPAAVLGDPQGDLKEARREARAVAGQYDAATLVTGDDVTAEALQAAVAEAGVVHFAGHAVVDSDLPQASHLRLARGARFSWMDLRTVTVRSRLVVLSGCETGRGLSPSPGESWGLATGFLDAGAAAVVASGWQVDDGITRRLMVRFHEACRSVPPAEALRRAQIAMLDGAEGAEATRPRAWAAFSLFGWGAE